MKKLVLFFAFGLLISNLAVAQAPKFGYINSAELLMAMPEKAKADTAVASYARSFQEQLEAMGKEFQTKGQAYQTQGKTMTDAMREVKEKELTDLQARIQSTQQSAEEKVQQKKQETYQPILDRADKAIKEVAKEKNYDYIFDASQGSLLYAKETENILPLVKAKLGLK